MFTPEQIRILQNLNEEEVLFFNAVFQAGVEEGERQVKRKIAKAAKATKGSDASFEEPKIEVGTLGSDVLVKNYLISEETLRELLEAQIRLNILESGGVDDWEWYSASYSYFCNVVNQAFNTEFSRGEANLAIEFVIDKDLEKFLEIEN